MARINTLGFVVTMVMIMSMTDANSLILPRPPDHPKSNGQHDHSRCDLEIRFDGFGIPLLPKIKTTKRDQPDDQGVRQRRRQTKEHGLPNRAANGDDESGHHRLGVPRLQAMQGSKENGRRDEEPGVAGALLQQVGEIVRVRLLHVRMDDIDEGLLRFRPQHAGLVGIVCQVISNVVFDDFTH